MAHSDYITCCKCDVKLIYDGDRGQRDWWIERFGKEPEIECPNCKAAWVGLTNDEVNEFAAGCHLGNSVQGAIYKAAARLKEKNT